MTDPIDIFITTKDRPVLLEQTFRSLRKTTKREDYRLTLVRDGLDHDVGLVAVDYSSNIDHQIVHTINEGLGPSINEALVYIDALKRWDKNPSPFTCYVQDDVVFEDEWLPRLTEEFTRFEKVYNLGFASGHDAVEHPAREQFLPRGMKLKDWIRATNIFGRHRYWMSMFPISRIDPETGRERGRPNDGMGSSVDWWFIRNHPNSVCKTGRTNLVIPGLVKHLGYKDSTWLKRELPESVDDLKTLDENEARVYLDAKRATEKRNG